MTRTSRSLGNNARMGSVATSRQSPSRALAVAGRVAMTATGMGIVTGVPGMEREQFSPTIDGLTT